MRIKIFGTQICGETRFECGPVRVYYSEPSGVSVAAFIVGALAEYAFKSKAQALGRSAGWRVEAVTLPLTAGDSPDHQTLGSSSNTSPPRTSQCVA